MPRKTDIARLECSLANACYYLRGWEIEVQVGGTIQLIVDILAYDKSDGHTSAIMGILLQHGLHIKDLRYNVIDNYMYYNIVAYVADELVVPDSPNTRVADPFQDELDNPLI